MDQVSGDFAAIDFLLSLRRSGVKLGLENMRRLCEVLNEPQKRFAVIHIAGTNGKGSVSACLERALRHAGFRTGLFTSPHLVCLNERFRVDGLPIADTALNQAAERLRPIFEQLRGQGVEPTFFEATTALAFDWFADCGVEVAVVETGLGGRLDSTNVVDPVVSVITSVGLDHQEFLGPDIASIAFEKAGIIKPGRPVVIGPLVGEAERVVCQVAAERGSEVHHAPPARGCTVDRHCWTREIVIDQTTFRSGLLGRAQSGNLACVRAVWNVLRQAGWDWSEEALRKGLLEVEWPARFQRLRQNPCVVLDGAHNADAVSDLEATWLEVFGAPPRVAVFGCLEDKWRGAMPEVVRALLRDVPEILICPLSSGRSLDPQRLLAEISGQTSGSVRAVENACEVWNEIEMRRADENILIFGSLYLAGEVLRQRPASTVVNAG